MDYDLLSSLSEDEAPAPMSLQPPLIMESFVTSNAMIKAINEQAKEQGFAVVICQSVEKKGILKRVYLRCDKGAKQNSHPPL